MPRIPAWPSINPAQLRHAIQVQQQTSTQDSFGQKQTTWTTILSINAEIVAAKQDETLQAGALTSQVTHIITLRFPANTSIQAGMRVAHGTHYYKIQAVDNVEERNVILELLCLELNAAE